MILVGIGVQRSIVWKGSRQCAMERSRKSRPGLGNINGRNKKFDRDKRGRQNLRIPNAPECSRFLSRNRPASSMIPTSELFFPLVRYETLCYFLLLGRTPKERGGWMSTAKTARVPFLFLVAFASFWVTVYPCVRFAHVQYTPPKGVFLNSLRKCWSGRKTKARGMERD